MKANEKRTDSPSERPLPVKGSDYFPPGAGWNRGNRLDESVQPSNDNKTGEQRRH